MLPLDIVSIDHNKILPLHGACFCKKKNNIVAAFRGMHMSPAKHSYVQLPRKCDYRTDTQTDSAFLHVQMESNWAGLSVCNCPHTGKWCGTLKAVGNTDHTRQTWIHMQTPLSPLAGCGPVGEGTSGKVFNWSLCATMLRRQHKNEFVNHYAHCSTKSKEFINLRSTSI